MQNLEQLMEQNAVRLAGKNVLVLKSRNDEVDQWFRERAGSVRVVRDDWHAADASHHLQKKDVVFMPVEGYLSAEACASFDYIFTFNTHPTQSLCENRRRLLRFGGRAFSINYNMEVMTLSDTKEPGFVISSYPRCGTHMVVTALSQNPALNVFGEVCVAESDNGRHGLQTAPQVLEAFWRSPYHGFAAHAYIGHSDISHFKPAAGYKHFWDRIPAGTPIISLRRKDLIARHISHLQARKTKVWNKFDGERPPLQPVQVDLNALSRDARSAKEIWRQVDQKFPDRLVVYYEDMCAQPEQEFNRMQEYLGVKPVTVAPTSVKLGGSITEAVTNAKDVIALQGKKQFRGDA